MSSLLITGGAGYVGSHVCVELLSAGHDVVVLDNFSNSSARSLAAVERITGKTISLFEADLRDQDALRRLFGANRFDAVLHFAGLKAVGESTKQPALYYDNNVVGSLRLFEAMARAGVQTLVFSSSATVYGIPETMPIRETFPTGPINPYGRTKLHIEDMLRDLASSDSAWRVALLRYFNPVGAHPSGLIGEDPNDVPNNLMPYIAQVAVGRRSHLNVFGDDYPTPDGTGIRDYIHVVDLAKGHVCALRHLEQNPGVHVHNLGSGRGYSVLEVVKAFERACGRDIPVRIIGRRAGDAAVSYADPQKANTDLGWQASLDMDTICEDAWRWQRTHPQGFAEN